MNRLLRDTRGAAAVELAIILPLLIVLVFGIIEFSIIFYNKAMITNASREGARAGIVFADPRVPDQDIIDVVDNYCGNSLITFGGSTSPQTTVTRVGTNPGDALSVRVLFHYDFLVLPNFIETLVSGFDLIAVTTMRME